MAAISRMPALSVVIKIFGPNNPFWILTTKGLSTFPLSVLKRKSAPQKTQLHPPGLANDFGLQPTWTGSRLESGENRFRQDLSGPSGIILRPNSFWFWIREHTGTLELGHLPSEEEMNRVDTGYSLSGAGPGGGFCMMPVCTGWKCQKQRENCALALVHTTDHLSLLSIHFWGLRKGSFLVPARLGFRLRFLCVVWVCFRLQCR